MKTTKHPREVETRTGWSIEVMEGEHRGRILKNYTLSSDGRYAQVAINREVVEFKLGLDCRWVYP